MFSYYGSKSQVIRHYPEPTFQTIIEPFAGSGRFALRYPERNCWLNDKYKVVADIWEWMIHASEEDIDALPDLKKGDDLREMNLDPVVRNLLGFCVNLGVPYPHHIMTTWASMQGRVGKRIHYGRISQQKKILRRYQGKLRHWKITALDYLDLPDAEATWFIDPPYQKGGARYIENQIDYGQLGEWCRSRKGQVIVCENGNADWLPFRPLVVQRGQADTYRTETIWTN